MSNFKDVEEKIEMTARANVGSMQQISKPKRGKRSLKMEAQSLCWPIIRWAWIAVGNLLSRPRHRKKNQLSGGKQRKTANQSLFRTIPSILGVLVVQYFPYHRRFLHRINPRHWKVGGNFHRVFSVCLLLSGAVHSWKVGGCEEPQELLRQLSSSLAA